MKRFFLFIVIVAHSLSVVAQKMTEAGVYDKSGKAVVVDAKPCVMNVELRYAVEHFVPGVYARYAQKYLGERASLTERREVSLLSGAVALGKVEPQQVESESTMVAPTLSENRFSREVLTTEERASATADMIFSLRKHRLDLITGEAGENVFGAGLKPALDEIARLEKSYLAMFYGATTRQEFTRTFNIVIDAKQSDYVVCRFNDSEGVVADDDLSGSAIVLHLDIPTNVSHSAIKPILDPKSKVAPVEYFVVPNVKSTLLVDTRLLDEETFALSLFARSFTGAPIE